VADNAIPQREKKTREPRVSAMKHFRSIIVAAIAVIGLMAAGGVSARPALAATCTNPETLYNGNSGLVLEVNNSSTAPGGVVDQWASNGTATQYWCLSQVGTDADSQSPIYVITNYNSGLCLDLPNSNVADGQDLQQWTCDNTLAQQWVWVNHGAYDTLSPDFSEAPASQFDMEVYNSSTSDGGEVDIWRIDNSMAQTWCPGSACRTGTTRLCVDSTSAGNQCIFEGGQGAEADLQPPGYEIAQAQWTYPNVNGATGYIESFGGACLQLDEAGGDVVLAANCVNDTAEQWLNIYDSSNSRTTFVSVYDPNLCLSADYDDGIIKADACSNNGWYQQWGAS